MAHRLILSGTKTMSEGRNSPGFNPLAPYVDRSCLTDGLELTSPGFAAAHTHQMTTLVCDGKLIRLPRRSNGRTAQ